jgi:hypothetical protein
MKAIVLAFLVGVAGSAVAQASEAIPRHLALARELLDNVKHEDNRYVLGQRQVAFPGDLLSSGYRMHADCSGFLLAIFERAGYRTQSQMQFLPVGKSRFRHASEDFVYSIENEKGYRRVLRVEDIRPGDLIAHALLEREHGTTGHVFLVDGEPRPIPARRPVIEGTRQFELSIIDSNSELAGTDDTRLAHPEKAGLGRGTIRVYADETGALAGFARNFPKTNRFFSYSPKFASGTKPRKAAIGRPLDGVAKTAG